MDLFVPEAESVQTQPEGMDDSEPPDQPASSSTPSEHERRKRKMLERKKRREARLAKDQLEKERLEREKEKEWLERDRLEKEREKERLEREKLERERLEREKLERERLEKDRLDREITINLLRWENAAWKYLMPLTVDPENASNVEKLVNDYMETGIRACTTNLRMVSPEECFQAVLNDRTHTVLLIAEDELIIDDQMLESARKVHDEAIKRVLGLKRTASDDLSRAHHPRKMLAN